MKGVDWFLPFQMFYNIFVSCATVFPNSRSVDKKIFMLWYRNTKVTQLCTHLAITSIPGGKLWPFIIDPSGRGIPWGGIPDPIKACGLPGWCIKGMWFKCVGGAL